MQINRQIKASFHVNYLVGKLFVFVQKSKVKTTSELVLDKGTRTRTSQGSHELKGNYRQLAGIRKIELCTISGIGQYGNARNPTKFDVCQNITRLKSSKVARTNPVKKEQEHDLASTHFISLCLDVGMAMT